MPAASCVLLVACSWPLRPRLRARSQTPPPVFAAPRRGRLAAADAARAHRPAPASAPGPAGNDLRPDGAGARQAAARRNSPPVVYSSDALLREAGRLLGHRGPDLPLLHRDEDAASAGRPREHWVPYNDDTEQTIVGDFKRLWATNFLDDLCDRRARRARSRTASSARSSSTTWRSASASRSSTTSGPTKVDQSKIDEKLKEKQHPDPARLVHRSGPDPPGRRRRARGVRRRRATSSPRSSPRSRKSTAGRSWSTSPSTSPKGRRSASARSSSSATRKSATARCGADEGEQGRAASSRSSSAGGTYKEDKFEDDAQNLIDYYRDHGYIAAAGRPAAI